MKWITALLTLGLFMTFPACRTMSKMQSKHTILWVSSIRVPCTGVAPMQCLQVIKGESNDGSWQSMYQEIENFDWEPGYLYKLKIKETSLDPKQVPADASSVRYELVKILSRTPDKTLRLNDIRVLNSIQDRSWNDYPDITDKQRPYLEIHISRQEMIGSDGCNRIQSRIEKISDQELVFGPVMSTKMACRNMELPGHFADALNVCRSWIIEDRELVLFDEQRTEQLRFKKVD